MNRLLLALCVVALVVAGKGGKGKGKGKKDDGKFGVSTPRLLWVRTPDIYIVCLPSYSKFLTSTYSYRHHVLQYVLQFVTPVSVLVSSL